MFLTTAQKIRIEMVKKNIKGAAIARKIGVRRWSINKAITGELKSYRLRKAICEATGLPMSIWDEEAQEKAA